MFDDTTLCALKLCGFFELWSKLMLFCILCNGTQLCIVIDRRKTKDNLLIYLLPLKYSAIPRNYCNETLIYSSAHHMMYDVDNSILKRDLRKYSRAKQVE